MTIDIKTKRQTTAYEVRQLALGPRGNLEGWRVARLMRDATTLPQVTTAERKVGLWLRSRGLVLPQAA
jgi:hypothetical protein